VSSWDPADFRGCYTVGRMKIVAPGAFYAVIFPSVAPKIEKPRVEAAAGVEAQNAPTPAWKTHRTGFPQLPHALSSVCQSEGVSFSVVWGSKDPVA
jgi:hypothetical protein